MHLYSYLALGDSYTIGEAVELHKSFPYQVVQILRKKEYSFLAPEIIAKTGWTTDELDQAIKDYSFLPKYDFVTLLIGVNNQYRGREILEFKEQLEELLIKAIELAGKKEHMILLSIPDYGVTPFAASKDVDKIAHDIDLFNSVIKALSIQYKVHYIDITPGSRMAKSVPSLVAADGLHPSEIEYSNWAERVADIIISTLK